MFKHLMRTTIFVFISLGLASQASATLILENYASGVATPTSIGGYAMTDFAVTNPSGYGSTPGTTSSVASPISGSLNFLQGGTLANNYLDGSSVSLERRLADSESWWKNGEGRDYDIFTTDLHLITILLPQNTRAFSFNVGADVGSTSNNAWLLATESYESGIDKTWFNVNRTNTPGFGIYAANDASGNCSTLTSVTIDPLLWGFGNFSINQGGCTSVPEPAPIALLALGLIGLGFMRKKHNA